MASVAATGIVCRHNSICTQTSSSRVQRTQGAAPALMSKLTVYNSSKLEGAREVGGQACRNASICLKPIGTLAAPGGSSKSTAGGLICRIIEQRMQQAPKEMITQDTNISSTLATRWREIQGANDWQGLLDPMDPVLREELIRYGEFAQSCYDAFDNQPHSKYMGSCLYGKDKMLEKVGLPNTGYKITDYLFATTSVDSFLLRNDNEDAWSRSSNWVGYIAVCTDDEKIRAMGRRDIVIAWRGTATKLEWAANLAKSLVPSSIDERHGTDLPWNMQVQIEEGFLNLYTTKNSKTRYNKASVREQILMELRRLISKYDNETLSITVTGHSLGGAMAVLSAYDIAMSGVNRHGANVKVADFNERTEVTPTSDPAKTKEVGAIPVTAFTFAGPRVGNNPFADKVRELGVKVLRVVNVKDMVPKVPSFLLNEEFTLFNNFLDRLPWTYSHVGVEIELDHDHSPVLHRRGNPVNAHNMEAYLHLLTGYHGPGKLFKQCVDRDLALINKGSEFVCPKKTGIPANWWQPENKGLIRSVDGKWVQVEREFEDIPDHIEKERTIDNRDVPSSSS